MGLMNMRKKKILIIIMSILCVCSILSMVFALNENKRINSEFIPPSFESNVYIGMPEVSEELGWSQIFQDGMPYKVGLCGNIVVKDNKADIYFTNISENNVWMKLRIFNSNDEIIAETGLIKQGQYIKSINFNTNINDGDKIKIKVMAYEPDTYYSAGSIVLNTYVNVD